MARNHCDPDEVSQVMYTEQIKDLADDDVLVFIPEQGEGICMSKQELMQFWDQETGWNWGNCRDFDGPVTDDMADLGRNPEQYCNKYYKIPATNQYISDLMREALRDSDTQVWALTDSGERRVLGRGLHYESEYNNPSERIYQVCPEGTECDYEEHDIPEALAEGEAVGLRSELQDQITEEIDASIRQIFNSVSDWDMDDAITAVYPELERMVATLPVQLTPEDFVNNLTVEYTSVLNEINQDDDDLTETIPEIQRRMRESMWDALAVVHEYM